MGGNLQGGRGRSVARLSRDVARHPHALTIRRALAFRYLVHLGDDHGLVLGKRRGGAPDQVGVDARTDHIGDERGNVCHAAAFCRRCSTRTFGFLPLVPASGPARSMSPIR